MLSSLLRAPWAAVQETHTQKSRISIFQQMMKSSTLLSSLLLLPWLILTSCLLTLHLESLLRFLPASPERLHPTPRSLPASEFPELRDPSPARLRAPPAFLPHLRRRLPAGKARGTQPCHHSKSPHVIHLEELFSLGTALMLPRSITMHARQPCGSL